MSLACLGQGRARHVLIFLLSRMPLAAALAGSAFAAAGMLGRLASASPSEYVLGETPQALEASVRLTEQ